MATDPAVTQADAGALGVELVSKERLLADADFVSLHAPLTHATRHMVGAAELAAMKPTAYLINCARGGSVDQHALVNALWSGRLAGAGLDLQEFEPPSRETLNALLTHQNVILTPHVAWYSEESMADRQRMAAETVSDALLAAER